MGSFLWPMTLSDSAVTSAGKTRLANNIPNSGAFWMGLSQNIEETSPECVCVCVCACVYTMGDSGVSRLVSVLLSSASLSLSLPLSLTKQICRFIPL